MRGSRLSLLLLTLVFAVGCFRRPPPPRFTTRFAAIRAKLAAVVRPPGLRINLDARAVAATHPEAPPPPATDDGPPTPSMAPRPRPAPAQARPMPTPPPTPYPGARPPPPPYPGARPPTIDRIDASRPTVFVLRGQTRGGDDFCETHTTREACTTACTAMLRQNALAKPGPTSPTGCACTEADRGC